MWRVIPSSALMASSAAAEAPSPGSIDVDAIGRALASNNDWRAIAIVLIFVIVALIGLLTWLVVRFLNASTETATAMSAMSSTVSRMESVLTTGQSDAKHDIKQDLQVLLRAIERERR